MEKLKAFYNKLVENKSVKSLVLKSLLFLIIPYIYLFICGTIFDMLLKWYFMTTFIFVSLCILYLIAIALVVVSVIKYIQKAKFKH